MKTEIRPRGITLTKPQRTRLEHHLGLVFARFGDRIDRVIVRLSNAAEAGLKHCELEVQCPSQLVKVEHSDTDVFLALEHAANRAARSVIRAIETEDLARR